ncbi:unnamed protein product [Eruca vesicaria subsp. sativa]|uniref:Uncharacterized protein n=1 Tax=Eruca vesicaria subsp. sativa TaxID=29727 RepID=A0ABC8LIB6_ERUVS|nr:unnamed protein product [Eruca vesicaria subsp. sativa]
MPPFRFNIPFFSYGSPSRPSSGTSSPSPPPTPPPTSRPPFRPGGIAQPSKPATSLETKPKVSPSLSRAKSNVAATAASSSSASQLPSRGAATPSRLAKQSNHSDSPAKKPERAEEQKVAMKDQPSREVKKEAGENSNPVVEKPQGARSEQKEAKEAQEQRKMREVEKLAVVDKDSKTAQKSKETEKLALEEKKKGLQNNIEEKTKTAQKTEKLAVEEKKKGLQKDMEEKTKRAQETERLAVEAKKKGLQKSIEEKTKTAQETERLAVEAKKKGLQKSIEEKTKTAQETEKLAVEEKKKVLQNDMNETSMTSQEQLRPKETEQKRNETEKLASEEKKAGQEQQKIKATEKLAAEERQTSLKTVGTEDATQSKTTQHITAASESSRGSKDLPIRNTQNRIENHTDENNQNSKEGSSSMSRKIKEDIRDGLSKLTWGKSNGDNEKSVSVYTLTGENRGATMAIGSGKDKKDGEVHIRRGYKSNPDESPETTATETEGGTKPNPKDEKEDARVRAYVNGNSQGVNNSIICDSSVQQNDPGIHMNMKFEKSNKKDETIISPPENVVEKKPVMEKMKYEPRVRRRCLRGLLAESSESDPGNPSKPRRHGCRFTCKDKDIENT